MFEFLARAQSVRETPIRNLNTYDEVLWLADFPEHDAISTAHRMADPQPDDELFTISRVPRTDMPVPTLDLEPWIRGQLKDTNSELRIADSVPAEKAPLCTPRMSEQGLNRDVYLSDEPEIFAQAEEFIAQWRIWAERDRRDAPVRDLYDQLFEILQQVISHGESFELVLGVGALAWEPDLHDPVLRHLLTFPAQIEFEDKTGKLIVVRPADMTQIKAELDMLDPSLVSQHVNNLRTEAKEYDGHPLHRDNLHLELLRFAHGLDAHGSYTDDERASTIGADAIIAFAPALIMRKRSQRGMIDMFETIRQQIEETGEVPAGLLPMIDPDYRPTVQEDNSPGGIVEIDAGSEEIFLPMPVNDRQLQVIQQVNRKAQVVVQGPPGTGKTHTAAAMLSHLLAQGKRVLVTAHTDRALHEVRGKLPEAIRPLSVAVVGNSQAEMADLRVAVETINNHADEHDAALSQRTVDEHLASIDRLRAERAETFTRLRQSREAETVNHTVGPYTGTLAALAQQLQDESTDYDWIETLQSVSSGSSSPLNSQETLRWLELLNDLELAADGDESLGRYPTLYSIPDAASFSAFVDDETRASLLAQGHAMWREHDLYTDVLQLDAETRDALHEKTSELAKKLEALEARSEGWASDALADIRSGRGTKWQARQEQIGQLIAQANPFVEAVGVATTVHVDSTQLTPLVDLGRAIYSYLEQGGEIKKNLDGTAKIGLFSNKVIKQSQAFFDSVRVDERPAVDAQSVSKFLNFAEGTRLLDAIDRQWPENLAIPEEDTLNERMQWHRTELGQLSKVMELGRLLAEAESWVSSHNVRVPNWADIANVQSYAGVVEAAMSADTLENRRMPLESLATQLAENQQWSDVSPSVSALDIAVVRRDRNAYENAYQRVAHLHNVRARHGEYAELQEKLAVAASGLVEAVLANRADPTWVTRLGVLPSAWEWAATRSWIRDSKSADVNYLQQRLNSIEQLLRHEIEGLAATRAWSHAVNGNRMSGTARAYLRQYAQLVRRLGKGTGKYASKQRAEIREALDRCRPSVPVWIMPLYRIAEQFQIKPNMFDVVLVDEASQAGLEASFLQYLAPKIVVIGDDKQVSPSAVGIEQQQLRDLANQYLPNNPFKASWQDPKRSYFDEATMRFGGKITLIEHRRCVPEIIGFSNKIAYEPEGIRLLPVRQRPSGSLAPIKSVHVVDGFETGKTNRPEAQAIVDQITDCLNDLAYVGKSIGVISLAGKEQAKLITGMLLTRITPEQWREHDLRCGDAADFQGSERDVIFLSMVKTADGERRVGALTAEMYVQRYNVAASRAKDQMWLFHSLMLSDLGNPEDMRHALLDYVTNVQKRQERGDERVLTAVVPEDMLVEPFDSLFEQRVFNRIYSHGYSVIPQYPAEGYNIDLVVVGANGNLAIECDGDAWHGPDRYQADMARQRDLERCGWRFFRIRESVFYMDQEESLAELWPLLEDLNKVETPTESELPSELAETVQASQAGLEIVGGNVVAEPHESLPKPAETITGDPALLPDGAVRQEAESVDENGPHELAAAPDAMIDQHQKLSQAGTNGSSEDLSKNVQERFDLGNRSGIASCEAEDVDETTIGEFVEDEAASNAYELALSAIEPYMSFQGTTVPALSATRQQIQDSLIEILEVEGPMVGRRLQAVYARSSGQKLGNRISDELESVIRKAVRAGLVMEGRPLGEKNLKARSFRLPVQGQYRLRTLGDRTFDDVPIVELAALVRKNMQERQIAAPEQSVFRAVLTDLGATRLTTNVQKRLELASGLAQSLEA